MGDRSYFWIFLRIRIFVVILLFYNVSLSLMNKFGVWIFHCNQIVRSQHCLNRRGQVLYNEINTYCTPKQSRRSAMFGRRNPDQSPISLPQPSEGDLDLDVLPDFSDMPSPAKQESKPDPKPETVENTMAALPPPVAAPEPPTTTAPLPAADMPDFDTDWEATAAVDLGAAFVRPLPEPTPFVAPSSPSNGSATSTARRPTSESVIGTDDFFDGNYRSERGVRIQGKVRGSIESRQYIFVESSAQVEANLSAEDITISGSFSGKIECRHRLEITSSGKIHGEVQTALLVVQEGGLLDGNLQMPSPEKRAEA
jgi:cytoskeletal protein CcmA (bactofilin family)